MSTLAAYLVTVGVILVLCLLGLSFGVLFGRKSIRSCGRAAADGATGLTCPSCQGGGCCNESSSSKK